MKLVGDGFHQNATVSVNLKTCEIRKQDFHAIECILPANSAGTYDVVIGNILETVTKNNLVEYTSTDMPTIATFLPLDASPVLKNNFTL